MQHCKSPLSLLILPSILHILTLSLFFGLHPLFLATKLTLHLTSNKQEQVFTWTTDDSTLYYDNHETVRFRIEEEVWHDQAPTKATGGEGEEAPPKKSPYGIIASMEDSGMGPCLWWDGEGEEGGEEMEEWVTYVVDDVGEGRIWAWGMLVLRGDFQKLIWIF